jgi:short subunit dehydrogenase-like uncharacterized protein
VPSLLLYGARGYTASLISAAAPAGLELDLAAREGGISAAQRRIRPLALSDAAGLRAALAPHAAVLNCAGPFAGTWRPLVEACLAQGVHYLDLCAEWEVLAQLTELDGEARRRGVMLLPAVGFEVAASDALAGHVARRLPGAQRLQLGISGLDLISRGSAKTMLGLAGEPIRVRRDGAIVAEPRLLEARFDFGEGPRSALAVSWGDVVTASRTTGIPNIEVYLEATPTVMGALLFQRSFGWALRQGLGRSLAQIAIGSLRPGLVSGPQVGRNAILVARAEDGAGRRSESRLVTPEAYHFSAAVALAIAQRVLGGAVRPGFQTPAALLGPDFVVELSGVTRCDLA